MFFLKLCFILANIADFLITSYGLINNLCTEGNIFGATILGFFGIQGLAIFKLLSTIFVIIVTSYLETVKPVYALFVIVTGNLLLLFALVYSVIFLSHASMF